MRRLWWSERRDWEGAWGGEFGGVAQDGVVEVAESVAWFEAGVGLEAGA